MEDQSRRLPDLDLQLVNGNDSRSNNASPLEEDCGFDAVRNLITNFGSLKIVSDSSLLYEICGQGFEIDSFWKLLHDGEVQRLQSHFKWLLELEGDRILDQNRITGLKEKMLSWVGEGDVSNHLSVCQLVTQKLLLAVYSSFIEGDSEEALRYIEEATKVILEAKGEESEDHLRVYRYITMINKLIITRCSALLKKTKDNTSLSSLLDSFHEDIERCDIQKKGILCDDISKATFLAMKGQLAIQLSNTNVTAELFEEAVKLNPDCFDWSYHLYTAIRRSRREIDFQAIPSQRERDLCFRAHSLKPNYWRSFLSLANLYEDFEKIQKSDENVKLIIDYLEKAVELAPNNVSVNIKLAEAYSTIGRPSKKNIEDAEKLFQHCVINWPNNSQVFHKIGKFYNVKKHDTASARQYFEMALEVDSLNFPCLMDYFRFLAPFVQVQEMLQAVHKFIPSYNYKRGQMGKLLVLDGYLKWQINDCFAALISWLTAYDGIQEKDSLEALMKKTFMGRTQILGGATYGRNPVQGLQIKQKLSQYKSKLENQIPDFDAKVDLFQKFLSTLNNSSNNRNIRHASTNSSEGGDGDSVNWRRNGQDQGKNIESSGQGDRRHYNEAANDDGNWRRRTITNDALLPDLRHKIDDIRNPGAESERTNKQNWPRDATDNRRSRIQHDTNGRWQQADPEELNQHSRIHRGAHRSSNNEDRRPYSSEDGVKSWR